jgi:hypothetical protein
MDGVGLKEQHLKVRVAARSAALGTGWERDKGEADILA